jgi:hypothetical protein
VPGIHLATPITQIKIILKKVRNIPLLLETVLDALVTAKGGAKLVRCFSSTALYFYPKGVLWIDNCAGVVEGCRLTDMMAARGRR